jgi:Transglycosylase SLT domain
VTRPLLAAALVSSLFLAGCADARSSDASRAPVQATGTPAATPQPLPSATPTEHERPVPGPNKKIPRGAKTIARHLAAETDALRDDLREWLDAGSPRGRADLRPLKLRGLYQQRLFRHLTKHDGKADKVVRRLDGKMRSFARATIDVGAALRALVTPVKPPVRFKTHAPAPPEKLKKFYDKANRRSRIDWHVLASLNFVESKFGRVLGPSSAGARGPMQFLPSTWEEYGNGGDIMDPHDSILAAARYLQAWGAPEQMHRALYAYNHSDVYVRAVLTYARMMRRNPLNYYNYYFWQVFVITTKGDQQLTGPGRHR